MRFGIFLSLLLIGCANSSNKCGDKVVLLWPDAGGHYTFQEVQLSTLGNPYEARGAAAEIYYESAINDSGFEGQTARPRLTDSGGVCVPQDIESSLSLTAYAIMERIYQFENLIGTAAQVGWPRKVGVEIHMRGSPGETHNNAHYYGQQDVVSVVPYSRDGLPVSINHGILAHEHFHAHFQSQVVNRLNQAAPVIISSEDVFGPRSMGLKPTNLEDAEMRSPRELNNFILRGWNEGLADFFAGIFTGRPDSFGESLPGSMKDRALDLPLMRFATSADFVLTAGGFYPDKSSYQRKMLSLAYGQGAVLARLMYKLAHSGSLPPQEFLRRVMDNLKGIPDMVTPFYAKTEAEPDSVVPLLLTGVPLSPDACVYLNETLQKNSFEKGLPQCSP